ncbi:Protein of unknown function [Gryllus bimaculatus]|nr:Protein of unknown function [Gryllus bimaculatus]
MAPPPLVGVTPKRASVPAPGGRASAVGGGGGGGGGGCAGGAAGLELSCNFRTSPVEAVPDRGAAAAAAVAAAAARAATETEVEVEVGAEEGDDKEERQGDRNFIKVPYGVLPQKMEYFEH